MRVRIGGVRGVSGDRILLEAVQDHPATVRHARPSLFIPDSDRFVLLLEYARYSALKLLAGIFGRSRDFPQIVRRLLKTNGGRLRRSLRTVHPPNRNSRVRFIPSVAVLSAAALARPRWA